MSDIPRCRTCKWWGHGQSRPFTDYDGARFDAPSEAKRCGNPALVDIDEVRGGYLAVAGDGFGLDYPVCDLVTGPDFGCVRHEPKPAAEPTPAAPPR